MKISPTLTLIGGQLSGYRHFSFFTGYLRKIKLTTEANLNRLLDADIKLTNDGNCIVRQNKLRVLRESETIQTKHDRGRFEKTDRKLEQT